MRKTSSPFAAAGALLLAVLFGCKAGGESLYVKPAIAERYQAFCEMAASNPDGALAALEQAREADPANAYTLYLIASHQANQGNFQAGLAALKAAEPLEKTVQYLSVAPPNDTMQSLSKVRQISYSAGKAASLGGQFQDYCRMVRVAGARIAQSEPVSSLSVLTGTGIVRRTFQEEIKVLTAQKRMDEVKEIQKDLDSFVKWTDELLVKLAEQVRDLMREAGKAANLNDEELSDYAMGKKLKDSGKQRRADEARVKIYEEEIAALRGLLKTFPNLGQDGPN